MSSPLFARSFPSLPAHSYTELSTAEILEQTVDAKIRELEARLAERERAAGDAELLAEAERAGAARLRDEIAGWRNLRRWLAEDGPRD